VINLNDTTLGLISAAVPLLIIGFLILRRLPWIFAFFVALLAVGLGYLETTGAVREFGHNVRAVMPEGVLGHKAHEAEPASGPAMAPAPAQEKPAEGPAMAPASPPAETPAPSTETPPAAEPATPAPESTPAPATPTPPTPPADNNQTEPAPSQTQPSPAP
jgi:outer membrane biosynthesis protein TonB